MSGKGSGIKYCSGESMENNHLDNNNRINNSTALSSNLKKITPNNNKNNVHINKSANGAPKRSLHRVNGANGAQSATTTAAATQNLFKTTLKNKRSSILSTGNNKKSVTSKAQAALAGATERDRARRRERRKRGGIKKKHKDAHKDTNTGGNVGSNLNLDSIKRVENNRNFKKRKLSSALSSKSSSSSSITNTGLNSLKKHLGNVSSTVSYKTINENYIKKACKDLLNNTNSAKLKEEDTYNQILSFAFTSSIFTLNATEKKGIEGEISKETLNGIAIKNCKHALMMLLK